MLFSDVKKNLSSYFADEYLVVLVPGDLRQRPAANLNLGQDAGTLGHLNMYDD